MIKHGQSSVVSIKLGTQTVSKIYKGENLIWSNVDFYGIRWPHDGNGPVTIERIGNMEYHKTLPIQSKMRRCVLVDGQVTQYVSDTDYTKDTEGNNITYTSADQDIMVEIPEYYFEAGQETDDGVTYDYLKLYPYAKKGTKVPKHYMGAFEASLNRNNNKLFSTVNGTNIVYEQDGSVSGGNLTYADWAANFRGGNNSTSYTGAKTLYGRPATNITIANFCTYAINKGSGYSIVNWEARNSLLRLYLVEYANFNSQDTYTEQLTQDGYHQGGLGFGVVSDTDAWNNYNAYNPIMPCGVTIRLGNKTGIVKYNLGTTYGSSDTYFNVPSYRGVENPFGHIWEMVTGMYIHGSNSVNNIYTSDEGVYARTFPSTTSNTAPTNYSLRSNNLPLRADWPTNLNWPSTGNKGDFLPGALTTNASNVSDNLSITRDYFYGVNSNAKRLMVGGSLNYSVGAGLFYLSVNAAVSRANANVGSRLLYVPNEQLS